MSSLSLHDPAHEGAAWLASGEDGLSEADLHVFVVKHCVIVREEIKAENPHVSAWGVHEFDDTGFVSTLEPLVSVNFVLEATDCEFDIGNLFVLLLGALADGEGCGRLVALKPALEEVVVDLVEVLIRYHIQRCATVSHRFVC